jgi:hypothetical protein
VPIFAALLPAKQTPANPASIARSRALLLAVFASLLLLLNGCKADPVRQGGGEMSTPADFALEFRVHGKPGATDVADKTVDFVVEPNRALRVAGNSWGSQGRVFPPFLRYLDYKEFNALYRLIDSANLTVEPTGPNGELGSKGKPIADAWYEVTLTASGRMHSFATTGAESPPTAQLLVRLHELRTGRPIGSTPKPHP